MTTKINLEAVTDLNFRSLLSLAETCLERSMTVADKPADAGLDTALGTATDAITSARDTLAAL